MGRGGPDEKGPVEPRMGPKRDFANKCSVLKGPTSRLGGPVREFTTVAQI